MNRMELVLTPVISVVMVRKKAQWNEVPDIKTKDLYLYDSHGGGKELTPANYPLMSIYTFPSLHSTHKKCKHTK